MGAHIGSRRWCGHGRGGRDRGRSCGGCRHQPGGSAQAGKPAPGRVRWRSGAHEHLLSGRPPVHGVQDKRWQAAALKPNHAFGNWQLAVGSRARLRTHFGLGAQEMGGLATCASAALAKAVAWAKGAACTGAAEGKPALAAAPSGEWQMPQAEQCVWPLASPSPAGAWCAAPAGEAQCAAGSACTVAVAWLTAGACAWCAGCA